MRKHAFSKSSSNYMGMCFDRFKKIDDKINLSSILFIIAGMVGALIFITIYGAKVLNPQYTDWLMFGSGDLPQHYLGWCFFRESEWEFPLGMFNKLCYPHEASIIFTDSIPLLALLFKLLSAFLPTTFQYFGIWGIFCFSMQSALGTLICKKYSKRNIEALLGGMILTICPIMIWRMFTHTALAAQWIILLSWLPIVYEEKFENIKVCMAFWFFVGSLCGMVHLYFIPLCGFSLFSYVLNKLVQRKYKGVYLPVITYIFGGILSIWLLGGFSGGVSYTIGGFGYFNSNVNTYIGAQEMGRFLANLQTYGDGQYEGAGYLGAGTIMLLIVVFSSMLQEILEGKVKLGECVKGHLPILTIFLVSVFLSIIPNIAWGEDLIFQIKLPESLVSIMNIFRANGRFIWGSIYALIITALFISLRRYSSRFILLLFSGCLLIQIGDLQQWLLSKQAYFGVEKFYESSYQESESWDLLAADEFEHVWVPESITLDVEEIYSIANWAVENGMTMNRFYFARGVEGVKESLLERLENPKETDLFIFKETEITLFAEMENLYCIDEYVVATVKELDYLEEYKATKWIAQMFMGNGQAEYTEEGVYILHANGVVYGPYAALPAGNYKISIHGENFAQCGWDCVASRGTMLIERKNEVVQHNKIEYEISIDSATNDMEFRLYNNGNEPCRFDCVEVELLSVDK